MTRYGPRGGGSPRRPTRTGPTAGTPPGSPTLPPPTRRSGTGFGRTEALADLARPAGVRRWLPARVPGLRRHRPDRAARREAAGPGPRRWRPAADGERRRRRPAAGLRAGRWWSRVRRGRPARLALRIAAVAAVSIAVVLVAGPRPATPALITGAVTWLAVTARHD